MHRLVVSGKAASSWEFWQMTPGQVWWLIEDTFPKLFARDMKDVGEIRNMVKRAKAKEQKAQENV